MGSTHKVEEKNGLEDIKERINKIDSEAIRKQLSEMLNEAFKSNVPIPSSSKDSVVSYRDYYIVPTDIRDPESGNILYRKGDKVDAPVPDGQSLDLCFIDGSDKKQILDIVTEKFGSCVYFVNNRDTRELKKLYPEYKFFPIGKQNYSYVTRFSIDSLPTKIHKVNNTVTKTTINIVELREKFIE